MAFTLADLNEAIADTIPEREAIVTPRRRITWRDLQLRTRRLAHLLAVVGDSLLHAHRLVSLDAHGSQSRLGQALPHPLRGVS